MTAQRRLMQQFGLFVLLLCCTSYLRAQEGTDNLFLRDRLEPVKEENIFKTEGYFNWGASIIKGDDGKYHMFYSRWKKEYTFLGWLTFSEVAHASAKDPAGPWKYRETVLTGRGKGHWDAITAHNPKIKFFDGKYYLYYQGFSKAPGKNGGDDCPVAVSYADSPDGPWTPSHKIVIPNGAEGEWDQYSIHDPYPLVHDGKIYIYPSHDFEAGIPFNDLGDHFIIILQFLL